MPEIGRPEEKTGGKEIKISAEIEKYAAAVAKDPKSRAFAPLAEAYRRAGMLDEAIMVAQDGLKIHPAYQSGRVALGRAYFDKGMLSEALQELENVTRVSPDNIIAQKVLGEIFFRRGDKDKAKRLFSLVLTLYPGDKEAEEKIKALNQPEPPPEPVSEPVSVPEPEPVSEPKPEPASLPESGPQPVSVPGPEPEMELELELEPSPSLEEAAQPESVPEPEPTFEPELQPETEMASEPESESAFILEPDSKAEAADELPAPEPEAEEAPGAAEKDGGERIATPTIAEIYVKQGLLDQALNVYREILKENPGAREIIQRVVELSRLVPGGATAPPDAAMMTGKTTLTERKIRILKNWLENIQGIRGEKH